MSVSSNINNYSLFTKKEPNGKASDNSAIPQAKLQTDNTYYNF